MNTNTRIKGNMSIQDVVVAMSDGNPGAITTMLQMFGDDPIQAFADLLLFDTMAIYGSKIYMIWNDCCNRDMKKFKETLQAFHEGRFSEEEIHENLAQVRARPFI